MAAAVLPMPILCRRGDRLGNDHKCDDYGYCSEWPRPSYPCQYYAGAEIVWETITGVTHANIMPARRSSGKRSQVLPMPILCRRGGRLGNDHRCYPCQYYVGAVGGTLQMQFDLRQLVPTQPRGNTAMKWLVVYTTTVQNTTLL
jgi:hypothetical protein